LALNKLRIALSVPKKRVRELDTRTEGDFKKLGSKHWLSGRFL